VLEDPPPPGVLSVLDELQGAYLLTHASGEDQGAQDGVSSCDTRSLVAESDATGFDSADSDGDSDGSTTTPKQKRGSSNDRHPPLYNRMVMGDKVSSVEAVLEALSSGAFRSDSGFSEHDQLGLFACFSSVSAACDRAVAQCTNMDTSGGDISSVGGPALGRHSRYRRIMPS
jgi:hypothetical protein